MKVVVVGGGIAGLSAAHRLVESNHPGLEVILLEASDRLGGTNRTVEHEGCMLELGPDAFLSSKPWLTQLAERLGVEDQIITTNHIHRRAQVVYRGKLHRLPEGFLVMAPTRVWPMLTTSLFSFTGKIRCALELFLPRKSGSKDESLGSFVRRRFGREILSRVVQPLIGGIYAGNPDTLSLRATMPRFLEMEEKYGSVIRGMLAQRNTTVNTKKKSTSGSGARYGELVSFNKGMETIIQALSSSLPPDITHTKSLVVRINHESQKWKLILGDGRYFQADAIILALPSPKAATLFRDIDKSLHRELSDIPHSSSAVMNLVYHRSDVPHPLDCFGFVVPSAEKRKITACTFSSVKFPNRAPQELVLMRVFIGQDLLQDTPQVDDKKILDEVRKELKILLDIKVCPIHSVLTLYPDAMPQYLINHLDRIERIDLLLENYPNLALAGNAYRGVGLPDCVYSGEKAADRILANKARLEL